MSDFLQLHSDYHQYVYQPTEELVNEAREQLFDVEFDTLVGTGLSGALVVPRIAEGLGKRYAIVRKDGETTHSYRKIEGDVGRRWIFCDDFISTGDTIRRVITEMAKLPDKVPGKIPTDWSTDLVGAYLYDNYGAPRYRTCEELKHLLLDDEEREELERTPGAQDFKVEDLLL